MKSFAKFEFEGWQRVAGKYDPVCGRSTRQSNPPLLDAEEASAGVSVLNAGCGPGYIPTVVAAPGEMPRGLDVSKCGGIRFYFLVIIFWASAMALAAGKEAPITEQELVRRTQELYDAVATGNQAPWKQYFADDCIFSDEKGRTMDKGKLVADITPLPTGYSGVIKLGQVQSRIYESVAVLSYDANETETIFGQKLSARYHITDTWLRRNGIWQILASQAHRYYEDPAVGAVDPKKFADFTGTYELASGQVRTVLSDGDSLFVERNGKKDQLLPETSDLFFRKGMEGRILFRHDKDGNVDALIDRRNNEDVVWRKKS